MNKKSKKINLVLLCFIFLVTAFIPLVGYLCKNINNDNSAVHASLSKPSVYIRLSENTNERVINSVDDQYAVMSNSRCYAVIRIEWLWDEDVTVTYHTENLSAIAGVDYARVTGATAVIKKGTQGTKISIGGLQTSKYSVNGKGREFKIVLDSAYGASGEEYDIRKYSESPSLEIISDKLYKKDNYVICRLSASKNYKSYDNSTLDIWKSEYSYNDPSSTSSDNDETWHWGPNFTATYDRGAANFIDNVINAGIGHVYGCVEVGTMKGDLDDDDDEFWRVTYGDRYYYEHGCSAYDNGIMVYANINGENTSFYGFDIDNRNNSKYIFYMAMDRPYIKYNGSYYFKIRDCTEGWNTDECFGLGLNIYNPDDAGDRSFSNIRMYMRPFDDIIPTVDVKDAGLETECVNDSKKIRLSIRFSEPVKVGDNTSVVATLAQNSLSAGKEAVFYYAGGSGTDTLYYEAELDNQVENMYISKVKLSQGGLRNFSNCIDYGGNKVQVKSGLKEFDCSIDYRKPYITVENGSTTSNQPKKTVSVQLTLNNMTKGTVSYSWVKENADGTVPQMPETWQYTESVRSISAGEFATINASLRGQVDGNYYLYAKAVSQFGLEGTISNGGDTFFGPFLLDNTKPVTYSYNATGNAMARNFTLDFTDENKVDAAYMQIRSMSKDNSQIFTKSLLLRENSETQRQFISVSGLNLTSILESYYKIGEGAYSENKDFGEYGIRFMVVDAAGNETYSSEDFKTYFFTSKPFFQATYATSSSKLMSDINIYQAGTSITFSGSEENQGKEILVAINSEYKLDEDFIYELINEEYEIEPIITELGGEQYKYQTKVTFNAPGYYEVALMRDAQYSDVFGFYITNNFKDQTANYSTAYGDLLLTNKVWQLDEEIKFTYLGDNIIHKESYGGATAPTFSSQAQAIEYLKVVEYQDLYLIKLTATIANYLNDKNSGNEYFKAEGESRDAIAGDYWVRYKREKWEINTESIYSWGYYFYTSDDLMYDEISIDRVNENENLRRVIELVATKISNTGAIKYLVGDENLDPRSLGPKLSDNQKSLAKATTFNETKTGIELIGATYDGDYNLYVSRINQKINGKTESLPIASNLELTVTSNTHLYIARYSEGNALNYIPVNVKNGTLFKNAINIKTALSQGYGTTGIYYIREIDDFGAREYPVFVDKDAPYLQYSLNDSVINELTGESVTNFYGQKFVITKIGNPTETDPYSYVAIYRYPGLSLIGVYYANTLTEPIELSGEMYMVEVGDRSGNQYIFKVYTNNEEIELKTTKYEQSLSVKITNRLDEELKIFNVYCNDVLINDQVTVSKTFSQNGVYRFEVEDIYGKSFISEDFEFTRDLPNVKFYYESQDGIFYEYKENSAQKVMLIEPGEEYFKVSTSRKLKIALQNEGCNYELIGLQNGDYTVSQNGKDITLNNLVGFTLIVRYDEHPEDESRYVIVIDNKAPTIVSSYEVSSLILDEVKNFTFDENGNPIDLRYSLGTTTKTSVNYGDIISAKYVKFTISDETKVNFVKVYYNNILLEQFDEDDAVRGEIGFYLNNKDGEYKIVTEDLFGTSTTLVYYNKQFNDLLYSVDGNKIEGGFDNIYYGNKTIDFDAPNDSYVYLKVNSNNINNYIILRVKENVVTGYYYEIEGNKATVKAIVNYTPLTEAELKDESILSNEDVIEIENAEGQKIKVWKKAIQYMDYVNNTYKPYNDLNLVFTFNSDGTLSCHCEVEDNTITLIARIVKDNQANYAKMEISTMQSEVDFIQAKTSSEVTVDASGIIFTNDCLTVVPKDDKVEKILVAFNPVNAEFKDSDYHQIGFDFEFTEVGHYSYKIVNVYGNVRTYHIIYATNISASITATFVDKPNESRVVDNGKMYYSNYGFTISVYKLISLSANNADGEVELQTVVEDNMTTIICNQVGSTHIVICDYYGNNCEFDVVIGSQAEFVFNENWIVGYNQDALRKDDGYTNKQLSINLNQQALNDNDITQIAIEYNDNIYVIYGYNNVIEIEYNEQNFVNCIGTMGDGVYKVRFSNTFGDVVRKVIYYSNTPTLSIQRTILSSITPEDYDIAYAVQNGIWSNYLISFSTTSREEDYIFTVRSDENDVKERKTVSYPFALTSLSDSGRVEYIVTYQDEYGFKYEFKVYLIRQEVKFSTQTMNIKELNGNLTTNSNVVLTFEDGFGASYSYNGEEEKTYISGSSLTKDGVYHFTVYDKAGNKTVYNIKKDSICEFEFQNSSMKYKIFNGAVINANEVLFKPLNNDTVIIKHVMLNGNVLKDYNNLRFTENGHWEILIGDEMGNEDYFSFHLVSHSTKEFNYKAPDNYIICEAYVTDSNGIKSNCIELVNMEKGTISLTRNGVYDIVMKQMYQNDIINFTVEIDTTSPTVTLVGCEDGETTINNISLANLKVGDIVRIYKNDKLIQDIVVSSSTDVPEIADGGKYRVEVTNQAGVTKTFSFVRKNMANTALSVLIIVLCGLFTTGLFIGVLYRNHSKTDD